MPTTTVSYTNAQNLNTTLPLLEPTIRAALKYIEQYVVFGGTLEVEVVAETTSTGRFGGNGDRTLVGTQDGKSVYGQTVIVEARTGVDPAPALADLQVVIDPTSNYVQSLWWDPDIANGIGGKVPDGKTDAFSVVLHELMHGMGIIGYRDINTGALSASYQSAFDALVSIDGGKAFFTGEATKALLAGAMPEIRLGGSQGIYHVGAGPAVADSTMPWLTASNMNSYYFMQGERYLPGRLELAMLQDLGWQLKPTTLVDVVNLWDSGPNARYSVGWDSNETLIGSNLADHLEGRGGNDVLRGGVGNDLLIGGEGRDEAVFGGPRSQYKITETASGLTVSDGTNGTATLQTVERLRFSDKVVGFDVDGNGGQAFRVYQAAFDRAPDAGGLGFWIAQLDGGASLQSVAHGFIESPEFRAIYGAAPTIEDYVSRLYQNVLHRAPEKAGYDWWVATMKANIANPGIYEEVLVQFSEGHENKANILGSIEHGFEFTPFG